MAVGFPAKTTYANGDVFSASDINDTNGTLNLINPTAKGSIVSASAADTPSRLTVGANNTVLIADSAQTTGLRWGGDWTTYTPTYSNITVGNGTVVSRYRQMGKTVEVFFKLTFGSTTSVSQFSIISLPVNSAYTEFSTGEVTFRDVGTQDYYGRFWVNTSGNGYFTAIQTNTTYAQWTPSSNTVPFTFGTNDQIIAIFSYEAA
jgi:hypothetical protein